MAYERSISISEGMGYAKFTKYGSSHIYIACVDKSGISIMRKIFSCSDQLHSFL